MSSRRIAPLMLAVASLLVIASSGCQSGGPGGPPDIAMTTSAAGLWVGVSNPEVGLEIQDGGFIKISKAGSEQIGQWVASGAGQIKATFSGQEHTMTFERKDLTLKITLPGESSPTEFSQM